MPRMNLPPANLTLAKLLLIGDGKLGKTFYAASAAKAGFNILYLDGDVGAQTIASMVSSGALTQEEAARIYLLNVGDTIAGGIRDTKFVEFMNEFSSTSRLRWDDTAQEIATRKSTGEIWEITPAKMGPNDILVIDSWTAYTESVMLWCGRANHVDIGNAQTIEMRPVYLGGGLKSTEMLQVIRSCPCNVIVIAHPDEFQHTTTKEGVNKGQVKEKDQIVDWTKMIPKTTSKPQGLQMSKYFTDVAWMELSPSGTERRLNFKPKNDRVCGGHFFDSKSVDEYSFANLSKQLGHPGITGPNEPEWIKIIESGQQELETPTQKILDGTKPSEIKSSGMSSLFQKK